MNIPYELEYLGFTPNEVKVYLTLLRIGRSKAGRLAVECRLERTSTYNALKRLTEQGIVSYVIEANEKVFYAAEPEKIIDSFTEKEERAKLLIEELKQIKKFENEKESVLRFRGYTGVKTVLNDILRTCNKGEEYLIFGLEGQLSQRLPIFAKIFVARKDEKKMRARALVKKTKEGHKMSKYTQVRYLSEEISSNININVYGDKVAIIIWAETPEAVVIDSKETSNSFKAYFEILWKIAKK